MLILVAVCLPHAPSASTGHSLHALGRFQPPCLLPVARMKLSMPRLD